MVSRIMNSRIRFKYVVGAYVMFAVSVLVALR